MLNTDLSKASYHLPGLFEFYEFYSRFLPIYREHREFFYEWCEIGSIYGAPADCLWGGGRLSLGMADPDEVKKLMEEYGISARFTFSNSLLKEEHLSDGYCNELCRFFEDKNNGIIVASDLLLEYLKKNYPDYYLVSSTTKVITDFDELVKETDRDEFRYVVPDFRLNRRLDQLKEMTAAQKEKIEFLMNECCDIGCKTRKQCYENVSRKNIEEDCPEFQCPYLKGEEGYRFSLAMKNPSFIGIDDITETYLPMGFRNFKIEGRGLGSALLLEFILYYMVKKEHQLELREMMYLDNMLDLF